MLTYAYLPELLQGLVYSLESVAEKEVSKEVGVYWKTSEAHRKMPFWQ